MGAALSSTLSPPQTDAIYPATLSHLPESCIALILKHLDAPQICSLGYLNREFREASLSDVVWESKLPENYKLLARKLLAEIPERTTMISKKDIYARLCIPIRFDGGTKEIWLDKRSGKMCMSISWRGLTITGIDDRRYWSHIPCEESRFNSIAFLQQVWWLEVGGELEFHFPPGRYTLFFRLRIGKVSKGRLGRRVCDLDKVHGWSVKPVRFQLLTSNGQVASSETYLNHTTGSWLNYNVGDFEVAEGGGLDKPPLRIKFSLTQIDCTHTKGGLCLDSVFILPSGCG